jgi:hypothetical protein
MHKKSCISCKQNTVQQIQSFAEFEKLLLTSIIYCSRRRKGKRAAIADVAAHSVHARAQQSGLYTVRNAPRV